MAAVPVVAALQKQYGDEIKFIIADTETQAGYDLAMQYRVPGIPAFYFINTSGEIVNSMFGLYPEPEIVAELEKIQP